MASSPPYSYSPTALSPPPSQSFSNSKKRPSDNSGAMTPSLKRRKASTMSVTSATHPLRQTSFPPDESQYDNLARSPSVDSMSLVSGMGGGSGSVVSGAPAPEKIKKKRGRKSKAEKAAAMRELTPSVVGSSAARSAVSEGRGGGRGRSKAPGAGDGGGNADEEDENIELDRAEVQVAADVLETTAEQQAEESKLKQMLLKSFSVEQFERYAAWRASGLQKPTVRKLVNATVSQSVPENVVLTVRTAAKVFLGDIIESARRIQGEWMDNLDEKQVDDGLLTPEATPGKEQEPTGADGAAATAAAAAAEDDDEAVRKWHRRGPLRPDHLREALRRYKLAQEGGAVGLHDPWHQQQQSGVERFETRRPGKRLFK
ncbi:hTAFII28-like protein conserved region-domain-containing protein [Coniochaeta sp. 2T2.1]|nr:hTAFII28-like protein conserved region-domain-containing protein [Coniochaeta sp. 2T2.1]